MTYAQHFNLKQTPQSQPAPGKRQVLNAAGGYVFQADDWQRLDRFLILGNEGGTYYVSEQALTVDNARHVAGLIGQDGKRVVARVVEISQSGRAAKNEPALFVLAMCFSPQLANNETRAAAAAALPKVARIGTHLFAFTENVKAMRGWGRGLRNAVAAWYEARDSADLALQLVKYQSRNGWSHRDVLRLAHPKHSPLLRWAVKGESAPGIDRLVVAFEKAKTANIPDLCQLIRETELPREAVPTEALTHREVWDALLQNMPMTAMIRNLGNMGKCGLLAPMSAAVGIVCQRLADQERIRKARVHPVGILNALATYGQGHGQRGSGEWPVVSQVVDALDGAFKLAFVNHQPIGKRVLSSIDCSGSMQGPQVNGLPGISTHAAAGAMALVSLATEPIYHSMAFGEQAADFPIQKNETLGGIVNRLHFTNLGGTDLSCTVTACLQRKIPVDVFVIYTDNETWAGAAHPFQAVESYRQKMGIPAKLVSVGLTATHGSIADPADRGMLDVVGFDTNAPAAISDFGRGD